jgi:hypothetical protein
MLGLHVLTVMARSDGVDVHIVTTPLFIRPTVPPAIGIDLRLMDVCSELWVCGDLISDGMRREMAYAADLGIPIQYVKEENLCTQ